jgi:starch synthase
MSQPSICFISSEVYPFAKTGGLADVSGALPKYLAASGCDVRTFMPLYSSIDQDSYGVVPVDFLQHVPLQMGEHVREFSLFTATMPGSSAPVYFVDATALYARG